MGRSPADRVADDAGGVWIITGWVLGLILYAGVVLAWYAGFSPAAPFVVIPAVLAIMVGAGNLISGRRSGRPAPRFNRPDPVPIASLRTGGVAPHTSGGDTAPGAPSAGSGDTGDDPAGGPGSDR